MTEAKLVYSRDIDPDYTGSTNFDKSSISDLMCWTYSYAGICIISWDNSRMKLGVYLSGIQIATMTLTANECKLVEEGDFIKIKANICLDVNNRVVTAKGYLRVAGERFNFDGVILNF